MGMTITEKILAAHSGRDSVVPGEIVNAKIDLIVAHDVTTPPAVQMLKKLGINKVFDPTKILVTPDHFDPCAANACPEFGPGGPEAIEPTGPVGDPRDPSPIFRP